MVISGSVPSVTNVRGGYRRPAFQQDQPPRGDTQGRCARCLQSDRKACAQASDPNAAPYNSAQITGAGMERRTEGTGRACLAIPAAMRRCHLRHAARLSRVDLCENQFAKRDHVVNGVGLGHGPPGFGTHRRAGSDRQHRFPDEYPLNPRPAAASGPVSMAKPNLAGRAGNSPKPVDQVLRQPRGQITCLVKWCDQNIAAHLDTGFRIQQVQRCQAL